MNQGEGFGPPPQPKEDMEERKQYEVISSVIVHIPYVTDGNNETVNGLVKKGAVLNLDPDHPVTRKWLEAGVIAEKGRKPIAEMKKSEPIVIGEERSKKKGKRGK